MRTLLVAAGGGGDAIAACMVAPLLGLEGELYIASYSWDRLLIDPLPGPRSTADFAGLRPYGEVDAATYPLPPAGSSLPRLAAELPARLFLLDPSSGVVGLAQQIGNIALQVGANQLVLVDVGGDVLARGREPGLRSPLADLMALAACTVVPLPSDVVVVAPGIDGEIDKGTVLRSIAASGGRRLGTIDSAAIEPVLEVFGWHPSEASGLVAAAARGVRGVVEVRDAGDQIVLDEQTASAYCLDAKSVLSGSPFQDLVTTHTLAVAASTVRDLTGVSELAYEAAKAATRPQQETHVCPAALRGVDREAEEAASRGADFVTVRRLAERLGFTTAANLNELRSLLALRRPKQYKPPLPPYRVRDN